jgi:hypothetical protein
MPTKLSEKKLLLSILLLIGAVVLFVNIKLFNAPVQISEKGILSIFLAGSLLTISIKLLKAAFVNN